MEKKTTQIIIVTGAPGVGKTSVSTVLAGKLHATHIDISELVLKENLVTGKDQVRGTSIADMDKVAERVKEIVAHSECDVVLDGHYAVNVVPKDGVKRVFVLRRDPEELKPVMEARGWGGLKLWENLACEILDVCLSDAVEAVGAEKVCEVDVTRRSVEDVVAEIVEVLENKRKCFVGVVDWLTYLEMQGRLDEFLKDF
ncbi:MAG TPA: adenylate kinase family protein [Candidatus Bathyarchaeia archaeon]|nr:adenylate kinase family protein [Candidatus Bathyarchaeia archaeon]